MTNALFTKWWLYLTRIFTKNSIEVSVSHTHIIAYSQTTDGTFEVKKECAFPAVTKADYHARQSGVEETLKLFFSDLPCAGAGINFLLHADTVRFFIAHPFKNSSSKQHCMEAAQLRFSQLYGSEDLRHWEMQAEWSNDRPFVVCAAPKCLLAAIKQCASLYRFEIDTIVPHFIEAWNRSRGYLNPNQWLLLNEDSNLVLGIVDQQGLVGVKTISPHNEINQALPSLADILQRAALSFDVKMPDSILLYGACHEDWKHLTSPTVLQWTELARTKKIKEDIRLTFTSNGVLQCK